MHIERERVNRTESSVNVHIDLLLQMTFVSFNKTVCVKDGMALSQVSQALRWKMSMQRVHECHHISLCSNTVSMAIFLKEKNCRFLSHYFCRNVMVVLMRCAPSVPTPKTDGSMSAIYIEEWVMWILVGTL